MGQAGAKQAGQTSLPGGCGRGDTPAVFHGSSTVPNDTTDTGERIKRRHTPLQFLVTESSRLYFIFFLHMMKTGCTAQIWGGVFLGEMLCGVFVSVAVLVSSWCLQLLYVCCCFAQTALHSDLSQSFLREDIVKFKTIEVSDLIIILITNRPESADLIQITDWSV